MNWFDEQIRSRKEKDDECLATALESIAGAVMGKRLTAAYDNMAVAQSAIEEILRFFGCKMKTDPLPLKIKTLDEQLEYRMRPFGIMRRVVKLENDWYHQAISPMLCTLKEDGSAVALIPAQFSGYTFLDMKTGKRVKVNRKTAKLFDTEALCFYQPLPLKPLSMIDLLKFMAQQMNNADIVLYIGMILIATLLGLMTPIFSKWLFGIVLIDRSIKILYALASFMICFSICSILVSVFRNLIGSRIEIKQNTAVQAAVMSRILSLPPSFFKQYGAGELTQRAQYVQSLCSNMMKTIVETTLTSLFSLIYLGQVLAYARVLVIPSLLITFLTILISVITTLAQMRITQERMLVSSKTSGMTYNMITGIQKIKLAGAEKRVFSRWANQYSQEAALSYNPPTFLKLSSTISLAVTLLGGLVLYYLAVRHGISIADYYAFNSAYGMVSSAFTAFAGVAVSIANIRPALEMAKPIMEAEPEIAEGKEMVTSLSGSIELSHVSFRYDDDMPFVLDDISLKIKAGEYLAVVGATGCGKSTLMRILLGFEKQQKGAVFYDRKDMSHMDLKSLRRNIGVVMQDGKLFLGDIFSNIVISAPQLSLADAWEAAEIASIAEDIRQMPMGMNTIISEGQGGISGGQRQRLMIARAVAPKPKILMFDEATSALDNVTQKKVSEAIDRLNCTRIVIAHRLSTIRRCDRIIVLDKGRIAEEGTYEELLAQNGVFAELVARQRLETK